MIGGLLRTCLLGESYWTVEFHSGKTLSELDKRTVLLANKEVRVRSVEWLEDIIGSGDLRHVKNVSLHTPKGKAHMVVTEPYTVFQFSRGTFSMLTSERIKNMQCIGMVTDKECGDCEYAIWDQQTLELYTGCSNVYDFCAWREGVAPIGRLAIEAMDLRLGGGVPSA